MDSEAAVTPQRKILLSVCLVFLMQALIRADAWMVDRRLISTRNHLQNTKVGSFSSLILPYGANVRCNSMRLHARAEESNNCVKLSELDDMDVVVYSLADDEDNKLCLGAVQEGGVLSPLSAWTDEPAFGDSVEFLVDEKDRFVLEKETKIQIEMDGDDSEAKRTIRIHHLLSDDEVSYGQRQCPRGVHNPHGEESEMLYYVEQQLIDEFQINMEVKPELETLW